MLQVPDAPFGLSWYQGDLESDKYGKAKGTFVGRFSEETFLVAPGHEQSDIEQVVSDRGRFRIVEKMQAVVRSTVIRMNPRNRPAASES